MIGSTICKKINGRLAEPWPCMISSKNQQNKYDVWDNCYVATITIMWEVTEPLRERLRERLSTKKKFKSLKSR